MSLPAHGGKPGHRALCAMTGARELPHTEAAVDQFARLMRNMLCALRRFEADFQASGDECQDSDFCLQHGSQGIASFCCVTERRGGRRMHRRSRLWIDLNQRGGSYSRERAGNAAGYEFVYSIRLLSCASMRRLPSLRRALPESPRRALRADAICCRQQANSSLSVL